MVPCIRKTPCSRRLHQVVDEEGDFTRDRTCKCDLDTGFYQGNLDSELCSGPKPCPAGYQCMTVKLKTGSTKQCVPADMSCYY